MEILYLLIPLSLLLVVVIALIFWWSLRDGQFEDLDGPAHSVVMDDDRPPEAVNSSAKSAAPPQS